MWWRAFGAFCLGRSFRFALRNRAARLKRLRAFSDRMLKVADRPSVLAKRGVRAFDNRRLKAASELRSVPQVGYCWSLTLELGAGIMFRTWPRAA